MVDFGNNLGIVINAQHTRLSNWASFAAWYSIQIFLPDSELVILSKRGFDSYPLFRWIYRTNVKLLYSNNYEFKGKETITIPATTMAVREHEGNLGPVSCKSEEFSTFVDYSDGCGSFVIDDWIDKIEPPFDNAFERFYKLELTLNEFKILKLWQKMHVPFYEVNK